MVSEPLPATSPTEAGVDAAGVLAMLDAWDAHPDIEMHSLMVLRHGHVVAEGWWAPYRPDGLHLLYSLSKSFTSTAVGLAVAEGLLTVDDLVVSFFGDLVPAEANAHLLNMRVRDLLSMSSGHRQDTLERLDRSNLVGSFLAQPPEEEPGTWFTYNQGDTLTLSAIVTLLTGERLLDYLRPRLLEPLGIEEANWQGVGELDLGFTGLHLTTESVAKLGQLYLQRGRWQGRQLLEEEWVAEATRPQVDNPREPNPDWREGYGYQFWMGRHGYRGDGAFGQFCLVLPEHDLVVVTTAATEDMQAVLDRVYAELLPGVSDPVSVSETAEASERLLARLAQLTLTPVTSGTGPSQVSLPWSTPAAAADTAIRVTALEQEGDGWRVTLSDHGSDYTVDCGSGTWLVSEPQIDAGVRLRVAASGGWRDATTFSAEVALVETPHRVLLSCDCSTGVTTAGWNVAPLGIATARELALDLTRF